VMSVVTLQFADLLAERDLGDEIFKGFGPTGLGALVIAGIPGFSEARAKLLPLSYKLAHASDAVKASCEDPESLWNAGWSHGKEKLGDVPDVAKGSFYANPLYDHPVSEEERKRDPYSYPSNKWPKAELPELEVAFKELGAIMFNVVVLLAKQVDKLVKKRIPEYQGNLAKAIAVTRKIKGRMLYYYPTKAVADDGWIGWHNDSGFLTALTSALYFEDDTGKVVPNPDPQGGLWVVDRGSTPVQLKLPADALGVQCGECLQVITGGLLVATPHAVRASHSPEGKSIGRASFPVFIDTDVDFPMSAPPGVDRSQVFDKTPDSRVPPLDKRWTGNGQRFGDFLKTTFEMYYTWAKGAM